jgi:SSS family solute:Na+ symporter
MKNNIESLSQIPRFCIGFILTLISFSLIAQDDSTLFEWSEEQALPNSVGLNGAFIGKHNDALIFAGGTNFPKKPVWEGGQKKWNNSIYILTKNNGKSTWKKAKKNLPKTLANGAAISTEQGLLCIGGDNEDGTYSDVFLLKWENDDIVIKELPSLPQPLSSMSATVIGDVVYLLGGQTEKGGATTSDFFTLNLKSSINRKQFTWVKEPNFPAKHRMQAIMVGQSNGHENCVYLFSGLSFDPDALPTYTMLDDVYEYNILNKSWTQKKSIPSNGTPGINGGYIAAAQAIKEGDSHILIFGGAGGSKQFLQERMKLMAENPSLEAELKQLELLRNTRFSPTIWAYHTITDTWVKKGELPSSTPVVTTIVDWEGSLIIPGGEISPGVRTNKVLKADFKKEKADFGWINYLTLFVYLFLMLFIGWYFSRGNKTTNDYFLGGGRIPWWATGLSIYATMLSAITYLSQPALAFAFDWQAYLGYFTILIIAPIVITYYLPFFRKLNVITAYEYLEKRFNVSVRIFGSSSFVLFQLVRMGIVVYLPALALATVIGIDIYMAIVLMGILAILYTYLGGIEAVIWTDVIQVVVLILGLIVSLVYIAIDIGDLGFIYDTALTNGKLKLVDLRFSFTEVVTWSLFLGSFALNLAPYTTDQAIVQRYMTTSSEEAARKSIWLNGLISIPAGILIFMTGTFLYVYFKVHPEFLSVGMQNDSVFPRFIANQLPPGVAGLVIAGIYSASMSSLDSSMHSVSTVVTVDFYKRFSKTYTEVKGLSTAKWTTVVVGIIGTAIACLMAAFPVKSIFFFFQEVIGLFGSALAGIFILGIFIKKANWKGTLTGAVLSVLVLIFLKYGTDINFFIYPLITMPVCVVGGYLFSLLLPTNQGNVDDFVYHKKVKP